MDNIIFRKSWFKTLRRFKPEQTQQFLMGLYGFLEETPIEITDERVMDLWEQVEPLLKSDKLKYSNKVKANQENGKLGGRPKKPTETQVILNNPHGYFENPKNLKEKDIDKDSDNDKDIDNDKLINITSSRTSGEILNDEIFYKNNKTEIDYLVNQQKYSKQEAIEIQKNLDNKLFTIKEN